MDTLHTLLLSNKRLALVCLSLFILAVGVIGIVQPGFVRADGWGQCMTGGWVGATWYSYDCSASEAAAASSCSAAGGDLFIR